MTIHQLGKRPASLDQPTKRNRATHLLAYRKPRPFTPSADKQPNQPKTNEGTSQSKRPSANGPTQPIHQVSLNDSDDTGSLIDEDDESSEDQASRSYSDSNDDNF